MGVVGLEVAVLVVMVAEEILCNNHLMLDEKPKLGASIMSEPHARKFSSSDFHLLEFVALLSEGVLVLY